MPTKERGIKMSTKLKAYAATILPPLLCASETWTVYSRHARKLNHFNSGCLRKLLNIKRQDKVPDTVVPARAGLTRILQCTAEMGGHVVRKSDGRLSKKIYEELKHGRGSRGGQKERHKDTLNTSLKGLSIDPGDLECLASDRST